MNKTNKTSLKKDAPTDATVANSSTWRPWMEFTSSEMFRHLWVDCHELAAMMKMCSTKLMEEKQDLYALAAGGFCEELDSIAKSACEAYGKLEAQKWMATEEGKKACRDAKQKYGTYALYWTPGGKFECVPGNPPEEKVNRTTTVEMVISEP